MLEYIGNETRRRTLLREPIHGYYAICGRVDLEDMLSVYLDNDYEVMKRIF